MRFPISMRLEKGRYGGRGLRLQWRGWTPPKESDESIWTGKPYWGEGVEIRDSITDTMTQIEYNKSWVYICVNYNSRSVARQRLRLYLASKGGSAGLLTRQISKEQRDWLYSNERLSPWLTKAEEIKEIIEHPFLSMMRTVNPLKNQSDLWMETETFMGLTGNCLWWVRPNLKGEPYQLWILEPYKTRPVLGEELDRFIVGYVYYSGKRDVPFDAETIVHHKYPNPMSKVWGLSPIEALSDPVKVNEFIYRYEKAQFKNMARPDGVIEMDKDTTLGEREFKRLKKEWKQKYGGVRNTGQVAVLEGGAKYKQISMSPRELNHLEGRKMTKEEIANGYGVPIPLISPEKSNLSNSVIAYQQYMRDTIAPKLKLYEQKINEQLLPKFKEGERLFCAFDDCVPENKEMALKEMETKLKTGYSSINLERRKNGEEDVPWGEVPILPVNMMPFSVGAQPKKNEKPGKSIEEMADAVAKEIYKRLNK